MRTIATSLVFAFLCTTSVGAYTAASNADVPNTITLPQNASYPNGITHAEDGTLFIGQITQGGILRRGPDGLWSRIHEGSESIFAGTALRLDEARNVLWGASPDFLPEGEPRVPNIFAIDTRTGVVLQSVALNDGFTNDIAIEPEGSILVTDSTGGRLLRLTLGETEFETALQDDRLTHDSGIGVGGIARAPNGAVAVGNFSTGRLYIYENDSLRELELPRTIENPDGMAFTADGSLIVLEGAVESGDGRVLRIANSLAPGKRDLEIVTEGLESPVNLTIASDGIAYVTESRIRHRLIEGRETEIPNEFRVVAVPLS
ncbi:hypothetical protein ABFT80_12540 [Mesorhizobium sp. SB112]|uniref:hypothetical protein n=1 Tax=Mesorhizobium sp. SB112 TaxID=3151853 RepID=UPI003265A600